MDQNQCVPNWDLDDVGLMIEPPPPPPPFRSFASLSAGHDNSMSLDYEMAELGWENGQLTLFGLVQHPAPDNAMTPGSMWTSKPSIRAHDTLESIVNQATHKLSPSVPPVGTVEYKHDPVPLIPNTVYSSVPSDALVLNDSNHDIGGVKCSACVGSCSVSGTPRVPVYSDWSANASESDQLRSMTTYGTTSTSIDASLDNTTVTATIVDRDHDSVCHSMPQRKRVNDDDNQKESIGKSTSSGKRRRTDAVHNQSERKRRDKIDQRMKTLQKFVPNCKKTDKASMLDEVIDYMKQLRAQVQVLSTMHLPLMLTPLALQQQWQMSMLAPMGMGMGLGMRLGTGMGVNTEQMDMSINAAMAASPNIFGLRHPVWNPAAYMSLATNSNGCHYGTPQAPNHNHLACQQSLPVTMDAYDRVAAMYRHFQQQSLYQRQGGTPR